MPGVVEKADVGKETRRSGEKRRTEKKIPEARKKETASLELGSFADR